MDDDGTETDTGSPDDDGSEVAAEAEAAGLSVEEYVATVI
jgi:hypothetical protein